MGFSLTGTVIALIILLPNLFYFTLFSPKNANTSVNEENKILGALEKIGQAGCISILIISKDAFEPRLSSHTFSFQNLWAVLMLICIAVYYGLWIRYVAKGRDSAWLGKPLLFIQVPMAVFPVCVFCFAAFFGKSIWLFVAAVILAAGHIPISYSNYIKTPSIIPDKNP